MRVLSLVLVGALFIALGALEAIASHNLRVAHPLPNGAAPLAWYWR